MANEPMPENVKQAFLEAVAQGLTVTKAAQRAGRPRMYFYEQRRIDEQFRLEWADANEQGSDLLEEEARRRAVEGVSQPHYDKDGNLKYVKVEYSDTLLIMLLKAARPAKFRDSFKADASDEDMSNSSAANAMDRLIMALDQVSSAINKTPPVQQIEGVVAEVVELKKDENNG
jgi:hypothetical protein